MRLRSPCAALIVSLLASCNSSDPDSPDGGAVRDGGMRRDADGIDAGTARDGATPVDAHRVPCTVTVSTCEELLAELDTDLDSPRSICMAAGDYGECVLMGIARTQPATVAPEVGATVTMSPVFEDTHFVAFDGTDGTFRFSDVVVHGAGETADTCSTNIGFAHVTMEPDQSGMLIDGHTCPSTPQNILLDDVDFTEVGQAVAEGRLSIRDGHTIQITNSSFVGVATGMGSSGPSDGIQVYGSGAGSNTQIRIGPGNLFQDIDQGVCDGFGGAHCDAIQFYSPGECGEITIEGNMFQDVSTLILNESPCAATIRNNVFRSVGDVQGHCWSSGAFEHNTVFDSSVRFNGITGSVPIRGNIFDQGSHDFDSPAGSGSGCPATPCTGCAVSHSLQSSGCDGTDCITAAPTYVGGAAPPATWAGWQLASGSAGTGDAHDGMDRGTLYYGP